MKKNFSHKKIYKFALYGRAASGKTCILAALAMKRTAHHLGYTCTWIPVPDAAEKNKKQDIEAFEQGREWLQEAIDSLSRHALPAPNPNRSAPLRYLYQFSTPAPRSFLIELIDYSGELIDPNITHDDLAKKLRTHLAQMDGILVLAEAPVPGQDMEPLSDEMLKLEQAFVTLQEGKKSQVSTETPVALLINKWDRRMTGQQLDSQTSREALQFFLQQEPEPPHRTLINVLKNSLPPELFQVFPVSAFGEREVIKTESGWKQERPRQVKPLRSFGLEDGFIWMAQKKDMQELQAVTQKSKKLRTWKFWQFFLPWRSRLEETGKNLAPRFLPESNEYKQLITVRDTIQQTSFRQLLATLLFMLFIVLSGEALYDGFIYKTIRLRLENPLTPQQTTKKDETWLEKYYISPPYRHFLSKFLVLGKNEAKNVVKKNRQEQEERFWQELQNTQQESLRNDLAERYLHLFPNGTHNEEAKRVLNESRLALLAHNNEKFLDEMESRIKALISKEILSQPEVDMLRNEFRIPYPQAMNQVLLAREDTLLKEISNIQIRLAQTQGSAKWYQFKKRYLELMRVGDIAKAAVHLQQWPARTDAFFALEKDFEARSLAVLQNKVEQLRQTQQWKEARSLVETTCNENELLHIYSEAQGKTIKNLLEQLKRDEDKFLYAQLKQNRDRQSAEDYLNNAPLQTMHSQVQVWNDYFIKTGQIMDLQLVLEEITWGDLPFTYNNEKNDITVQVNSQDVLYIPDIDAIRFTTIKNLGTTHLRGNLDTRITLSIKILSKKSWTSWRDGDAGKVTWTGTLQELQTKHLVLSGDRQKNTISIRLKGLPVLPPLPDWKPQQ